MEERTGFRAGAGEAELRFPDGYFPHDNCTGEYNKLHARAILLEGQEKVLIVSLELPSLRPFSIVDDMRVLLSQKTGVDVERVWLCMTHDLSAPHVPNADALPQKHEMHLNTVRTAILEAAEQAVNGLREARLGVGVGQSFINTNRDVHTNQGWWLGIGGDGPSDKTLTVLKLEGIDGTPIALIYHYALKSSVMEGTGMHLSSSEVSGKASLVVEEKYGVPVLFFMGAAGDQVPRKKAQYYTTDESGNMKEVNLGAQGYDFIEELGGELGRDICAVADGIVCTAEQSVLRYEHRCWMFRGQQFYNGPRPYRPTPDYEYIPGPDQDLQVELLCLGDAALFGLMPETSASIGMKLRQMSPGWKPCIIAMVNGGKDYISDELAYDRFTFGGTHSVFARGSAEQFLERAAKLLKEL